MNNEGLEQIKAAIPSRSTVLDNGFSTEEFQSGQVDLPFVEIESMNTSEVLNALHEADLLAATNRPHDGPRLRLLQSIGFNSMVKMTFIDIEAKREGDNPIFASEKIGLL